MHPSAPIGIFDSGVGGLTVAQAIKQRMPDEQLIYFGDTQHMPYGDKSKAFIETSAQRITRFLVQQGCKAIVIACNSASSNALEVIKRASKGVRVFDVINPIVESLSSEENRKLGIIATRATMRSDVYRRAIKKRCPRLEVVQVATPLLASLIEEGFQNDKILHAMVHHYLAQEELKDIGILVLACTHYHIIEREIRGFYNGQIHLIDVPRIVADQVYQSLSEFQLLSKRLMKKDLFYVSTLTEVFERQTKVFFGQRLILQSQDLDL